MVLRLGEQRAAQQRPVLRQDHPGAAAPGGERRREARGPAAHDQHVAMRVAMLVTIGIRLARGLAQARGGADHALVDIAPPGARPHEGLVVEAGRQQRAEEVVDPAQVELDRGPAILAARDEAIEELDLGGPDVGLGAGALAELDQGVGLLRPGRDDAARAMILEAPPDQMDAVGEQRRGQGVAGEALVARAVEGKTEAASAVDPTARGQAVTAGAVMVVVVPHGASSLRAPTSVSSGLAAAGRAPAPRRSIFGRGSPIR